MDSQDKFLFALEQLKELLNDSQFLKDLAQIEKCVPTNFHKPNARVRKHTVRLAKFMKTFRAVSNATDKEIKKAA